MSRTEDADMKRNSRQQYGQQVRMVHAEEERSGRGQVRRGESFRGPLHSTRDSETSAWRASSAVAQRCT